MTIWVRAGMADVRNRTENSQYPTDIPLLGHAGGTDRNKKISSLFSARNQRSREARHVLPALPAKVQMMHLRGACMT